MARKRYTAEEIISQLRTVEIETAKGIGIVDACRKLGITEQTYYRWKKEYGGLRVDQAKRLKGLEQENVRLKRLVADLSLDNKHLEGGGVEPPSTTSRDGSMMRTPCATEAWRWPGNMAGTGTCGSLRYCATKGGGSTTSASSGSGGRRASRCHRSSRSGRGSGSRTAPA